MSARNYAVLYIGARVTRGGSVGGGSIVEGGDAVLETGQHDLNGPEHTNRDILNLPTAETDTDLVLGPDGLGGVTFRPDIAADGFLTAVGGEGHAVYENAACGATAVIDCALANIFDLTLTANCTLTIVNPPASGVGGRIIILLRQGGSGSYTVTWPAEVDWQDIDGTTGGAAPTLWTAVGAQDDIELATLDGGTSWGGRRGAGGGGASALDDLTDVTITSPAARDRLRHNGSGWVNSDLHWEPMVDYDGLVMLDSAGGLHVHEVSH